MGGCIAELQISTLSCILNFKMLILFPVVEIDEDSHSRFMGDSSRSRHGAVIDDHEDNEWRRDRYCQPRNSVLNLVSEFVVKCTTKLQEINKKDRQEKGSMELLDLKCSFKLVDIAHSLIKMASYDQSCIKSPGKSNPQISKEQSTSIGYLWSNQSKITSRYLKIWDSVYRSQINYYQRAAFQ